MRSPEQFGPRNKIAQIDRELGDLQSHGGCEVSAKTGTCTAFSILILSVAAKALGPQIGPELIGDVQTYACCLLPMATASFGLFFYYVFGSQRKQREANLETERNSIINSIRSRLRH